MRDGRRLGSRIHLPPGAWASVLECLCARFPMVAPAEWAARFERGLVQDTEGRPVPIGAAYRSGLEIHYFRELADEVPIAGTELVLHADEHLVVADKPHFLPVMPTGRWVEQTLQARLERRLGISGLAPLHRLDRATAGLVLLSANPATRARYQALFRERRISKRYEAIAAPASGTSLPATYVSRLEAGEPFFTMREVAGTPNTETRIEVLERGKTAWRYGLEPVTGRKHQLRVHMAALGIPIRHDRIYPTVLDESPDDPQRPLALVARRLQFIDPLTGVERFFCSAFPLPLE